MTHARIVWKRPAFSLDVDLPFVEGVNALYGPAGAGKSLILETIAGWVKPDSGRVLLSDAILADAEARVHLPPRLRRCGYVGQRESLFPHLTVRKNLGFAAWRYSRLERHRRVSETMERFQLADKRPADLIPSERLRAEVARALLSDPRLLLLDDRGIDEALLRQVRNAVSCPILMVTADLDLCCAAVDALTILLDGRLAQRGAPIAVLDRPASVGIARLLGIANILPAAISGLDPGRNTSRLDFDGFALTAPYIPGHFRGDRVSVAVRAEDLRVHPGDLEAPPNSVPRQLVRASDRVRTIRLEFAGPIFADIPRAEFERQKDNKSWQVEFPPESLRVL